MKKTVYITTPLAAETFVSVSVRKATHLVDDYYSVEGLDRIIRAKESDVFATREDATAAGRRGLAKIRDRINDFLANREGDGDDD